MKPEAILRLEMRLLAIEHMIATLATYRYQQMGLTSAEILEAHDAMREGLSKRTFPNVEPASSDMLASELQTALEALLRQIEHMAGVHKG